MKFKGKNKEEFVFNVRRTKGIPKTIEDISGTPILLEDHGGETRITTVSRILKGIGSGEIRLIKKESETSIEKIKPKKLENERK